MPFSRDDFLLVLVNYNEAIWPLPIVAYLAAALVVGMLFFKSRATSILITFVLGLMWTLSGVVFHGIFFSTINPVASAFAFIFAVEAGLLFAAPWMLSGLRFQVQRDASSMCGGALILFAAILYPLWGRMAGDSYPAIPAFGVAPCPATIFTIGGLLMASWREARVLLVIPALWAVLGWSAVFTLSVPQDGGLLIAFVVLVIFAVAHWRGWAFSRHLVHQT